MDPNPTRIGPDIQSRTLTAEASSSSCLFSRAGETPSKSLGFQLCCQDSWFQACFPKKRKHIYTYVHTHICSTYVFTYIYMLFLMDRFPVVKTERLRRWQWTSTVSHVSNGPWAVTVGTTKKGSGREWLRNPRYQYDNNKLIHVVNLEISSPGSQSSEERAPQCLRPACGVKWQAEPSVFLGQKKAVYTQFNSGLILLSGAREEVGARQCAL